MQRSSVDGVYTVVQNCRDSRTDSQGGVAPRLRSGVQLSPVSFEFNGNRTLRT